MWERSQMISPIWPANSSVLGRPGGGWSRWLRRGARAVRGGADGGIGVGAEAHRNVEPPGARTESVPADERPHVRRAREKTRAFPVRLGIDNHDVVVLQHRETAVGAQQRQVGTPP